MAKMQTRARTVDMLGRQQIATVQNALAELFKNAYDADATRVQADYLCGHGGDGADLLCVRDNGVGMSLRDFLDKWLVIGTDNKTRANGTQRESGRIVTGEKGIGRLAIALLGRQVVVATRAIREDGVQRLVVAWIHWGLFEIPGVNLEDIELPVEEFAADELPDFETIEVMRLMLLDNIKEGSMAYLREPTMCEQIKDEICRFRPSFQKEDHFFGALSDGSGITLSHGGHGTFFQIGNVNENILNEIKGEIAEQDYRFRKLLLGFADDVFEKARSPFICSFKFWEYGQTAAIELLNPESFVTYHELHDQMDHYIDGEVDHNGLFRGGIRCYNHDVQGVKIQTQNTIDFKRLECGPFRFILGVLQKKPTESLVARNDISVYNEINRKLDNLGGIYIYRDGIRILPYGDADNDWLEIDKRRSLRAGQYFFSNRNLFGAIILTSTENAKLQEKAGREGLQKNLAYRQLRETVITLFKQIACDFFTSDDRTHALEFRRIREELKSTDEKISERLRRVQKKANRFGNELRAFFDHYHDDFYKREVKQLLVSAENRFCNESVIKDGDALISAEDDFFNRLDKIEKSSILKLSPEIPLSEELQRQYAIYQKAYKQLEAECFAPARVRVSQLVDEYARNRGIEIDAKRRLDSLLNAKMRHYERLVAQHKATIKSATVEIEKLVNDGIEHASSELEGIRRMYGNCNVRNIVDARAELTRRFVLFENSEQASVASLELAIKEFVTSLKSESVIERNVLPLLEKRVIDLQNQTSQDFAMVQQGVAVAIINHEFEATLRRIRLGLRSLREVAKHADLLRPISEGLINDFAHLDGYLNLFSPLQKRLELQHVRITGLMMQGYIESVFAARFARDGIRLVVTRAFERFSFFAYTSSIYPVLINLVDNACYWLGFVGRNRQIVLDAVEDGFIIANTSEPIRYEDRERIFDRGFSRKANGRGLGLHIAKKALESEGFDIYLIEPIRDCNVAFKVSIIGKKDIPR